MFERSVVRFFFIPGKTAGGKFPHLQMMFDAFAAYAFPAAGLGGAVAPFKVLFFFAFHYITPRFFYHCPMRNCFLQMRSLIASFIPNPTNRAPRPRSSQRETRILWLR